MSAGGTAEQASSTYASFYRILGDSSSATEASQNLARLTTNEQELQQWTNIAAGAYATFGDALPLQNLAEAAQETAHTGTVTGGLADALNWSTASAEQWSAALSGHSSAQAAFNQAVAEVRQKKTLLTLLLPRAEASRSGRSSSPRRLPGFTRMRDGSTKRRTKTFSLRATRRTR